MTIKLTRTGEKHSPLAPHNVAAWGGVKEMLRVKGGAATRDEILSVLEYCWHWDEKYQPNTAYLGYALKNGWLAEE